MSSLPDLSALTLKPHGDIREDAPDGVYCLDRVENLKDCTSSIVVVRDAVPFSSEATRELEEFMSDETKVKPTVNQYGGINNRRQATFGASYNFGQSNTTIPYPSESWPEAVQTALRAAKTMAEQLGVNPSFYNAVHANWYPSGNAGVDAHSDRETQMVKGLPIISFTLLAGDIVPRNFSILRDPNAAEVESQRSEFERKREERYRKLVQKAAETGKPPPARPKTPFSAKAILLYDVRLGHGDVLIMQGAMQTYYKHSVEKDGRKALANARRLNLTVRAFKEIATGGGVERPPSSRCPHADPLAREAGEESKYVGRQCDAG
jgi:alkylated DNA repair dioxygenase AlkB